MKLIGEEVYALLQNYMRMGMVPSGVMCCEWVGAECAVLRSHAFLPSQALFQHLGFCNPGVVGYT